MAEVSSRPNTTIYVSNLHPTLVTSTTLSEIFIPFGDIHSISLPAPTLPSSTDAHRGFGYVEFEDVHDAKEAIDNMDQSEVFGRVIKVSLARPDSRRDAGEAGLGSTVAVWETEAYAEKYGGGAASAEQEQDEDDRNGGEKPEDPMHGLEGLDIAGPKIA